MMRGIFTLVFCLGVSYVFGQAGGDYRSAVNGGSWNAASSWQVFTVGPGWGAAGAPPTSAAGVITIRNGFDIIHNSGGLVSTDQTVVEVGALLTISPGFQINVLAGAGDDLAINGTVQNNGTLRTHQATSLIVVNGTLNSLGTLSNIIATRLRFASGSIYNHQNSGSTSIPPATWNDNSTTRVTGDVSDLTGGLGQSFYDFEWNTPTLTNPVSFAAGASLTMTVRNNLSIVNTGGSRLYLSQDSDVTLNVGNDFTIATPGRVGFNVDGNTTVNVVNNFTLNSTASGNLPTGGSYGTGTVDINAANIIFGAASVFDASGTDTNDGLIGSGTTTLAMTGNYSSAGTFRNTGTAPGLEIRFTGAATHSYTSTAVPTFPVNFSVEDAGNLDIAATSRLAGPGDLTVATGAGVTLRSTSTNGAYRTTVAAGNVQLTGTRTINGTVIYGGTARQYMFSETPDVATTINNSANVDLRESMTFTAGGLDLQTGLLRITNNSTLTVANLTYVNGGFGYNAGSSLVLNGSGSIDLRLTRFGGNGMNNLTINRAGTVTQTTASLRVNGTLALSNGTLAMGNNTLQVYGPMSAAVGGALSSTVSGRLYIRGTGSMPTSVPLSGALNILEMARPAETFTTTGALSIMRLNLYDGSVAATAGAQMANNGTIYRSNGALIAAIGAAGLYDVQYTTFIAASITTGFEIPSSGTALNTLTINNTVNSTGIVALDKAVVAAGQIRVLRGQLHTDNFNITTGGNFRVDATGRLYPGRSTFTFNGAVNQSYNTLASAFTPYTLKNVVINKTAGSFTLSTPANIRNSFAVNSITTVTAGTNRLTLLSDADTTAYIPTMPGTAANNRGRINGSVVVQRYLPNGNSSRQYRYLSAPTTTTFVSDWQNEIPISGSQFSNPSSGVFDGIRIISKNPSMFFYNEPTGAYVAYPTSGSSTVATVVNGRGYAVFGRTHGVTPLTLDSHGTLGQWDVNVVVTNTVASPSNGYNLVGNPYPAPVDWDLVYASSLRVGATIALTDNNANSTGGSITYNGVTGIAVPPNSFDGQVSMGQGFWVTANAGAQAKQVRFRESNKVAGQSQFIRKGEPDNLLRLAMTKGSLTDHLAVVLLDSATDAFDDKYDGYKFETTGLRVTTLSSKNDRLVINALGKGGCEKVVPIEIAEAVAGSYTFTFTGMESFDADVDPILYDRVADKSISLASNPVYNFTVSDLTTAKGRFELRFDGPELNTQLEVKGETTCVGNSTAVITLPTTQSGVQYTAMLNGSALSTAIAGNGAEIQIPVSVDALPQGATEIVISAQRATCGSEVLAQKATITVLRKPSISSVSAGQICGTGTANLSAVAVDGSLYNWYEGADDIVPVEGQHGSGFITPELSKTKTYFVAAVNSLGCEGERVEVKAIVLNLTPAAIAANGNILTSNYEVGNQWYLDGTAIEGATGKVLEVSASGVYSVVVNTGTCTTNSEGREMVILGSESTDSFIRIYPNPAPDKVHIEVRSQHDVEVELISTTGVQLRAADLSGSDDLKTATFDITSLPDGMYLIRTKAGTKTFTKKILKAK